MLKISIPICASAFLDHEKYDGQNGLYMYALPNVASINKVLDLCEKLDIESASTKLHCTVMYSPKAIEEKFIIKHYHSLIDDATIPKIKYWEGHDKKTYIVAEVQSDKLQAIHQNILDMGAEFTYPKYTPHITLTSGDPLTTEQKAKIREVNKTLKNSILQIGLTVMPASNIIKD